VKRLIINADDFGLTSGVNHAVIELHQRGVLTSATLMAKAAATDEAIALALSNPTLGVGCHVVLVDGEPVLDSRHDIPNLADPINGQFRRTLVSFVHDLFVGRIPAKELEAEAVAQIGRLQDRGLQLTHVDTHKHTHMFPKVLRPLLRAARGAGIRCVRNPFEARWSLASTPGAPLMRRAQVHLLRLLEPAFLRIVAEEGFTTTQGALGVLATGTLDRATVNSLLPRMPDGTWELVAHPGYNDHDLAKARTRLLASRETEMDALDALDALKSSLDFQLLHFGQLHPNN
jgi:hopanoid biosynthesis associated protein HpnK